MSVQALPDEIGLLIMRELQPCWFDQDEGIQTIRLLAGLCRLSRQFYRIAIVLLYRSCYRTMIHDPRYWRTLGERPEFHAYLQTLCIDGECPRPPSKETSQLWTEALRLFKGTETNTRLLRSESTWWSTPDRYKIERGLILLLISRSPRLRHCRMPRMHYEMVAKDEAHLQRLVHPRLRMFLGSTTTITAGLLESLTSLQIHVPTNGEGSWTLPRFPLPANLHSLAIGGNYCVSPELERDLGQLKLLNELAIDDTWMSLQYIKRILHACQFLRRLRINIQTDYISEPMVDIPKVLKTSARQLEELCWVMQLWMRRGDTPFFDKSGNLPKLRQLKSLTLVFLVVDFQTVTDWDGHLRLDATALPRSLKSLSLEFRAKWNWLNPQWKAFGLVDLLTSRRHPDLREVNLYFDRFHSPETNFDFAPFLGWTVGYLDDGNTTVKLRRMPVKPRKLPKRLSQ
ncbi:hypothetical protein F4780DRAFT_784571 [Xylariomycetidae sp. FL0641]|nr:hypothetical protein F4780DRAFT_784571 [Xylariomycetidae sp. FL0641]